MDATKAIDALSALSQITRLETFRLLVKHEPAGLPAGEVARLLGVPQNTMSAHLAVLTRAGLTMSDRHGRSIIYRANLNGLQLDDTLFGQGLLRRKCAVVRAADGGTDALPLVRKGDAMTITIYHNPGCGTSRNVLALIRNSGEEPVIIEYLTRHRPGRVGRA